MTSYRLFGGRDSLVACCGGKLTEDSLSDSQMLPPSTHPHSQGQSKAQTVPLNLPTFPLRRSI